MSSANQIETAALAKLNTAISPNVAYRRDKAPTSGADYLTVVATRRYGGNDRGGRLSPSSWRLTIEAVGSSIDNAQLLQQKAEAIEGFVLTVGSEESTPATFETEALVDPAEAQRVYWSLLRSYTFAF